MSSLQSQLPVLKGQVHPATDAVKGLLHNGSTLWLYPALTEWQNDVGTSNPAGFSNHPGAEGLLCLDSFMRVHARTVLRLGCDVVHDNTGRAVPQINLQNGSNETRLP